MISNIQALRALAAIAVVYFHLSDVLTTARLPVFGSAGVDLFFVISGFVMVIAAERRDVTPSKFLKNRIARIVPIYWLMTFAVFAVSALAPHLVKATRPDVIQLLESLLFVPFRKANGLVQPVLFVGWSLNYEMFFYCVFALGLIFADRRSSAAFTLGVLVLLVAAGAIAHPAGVIANFYTNPIILEFGLGILAAYGARTVPPVPRRWHLALASAALAMLPLLIADINAYPALPAQFARAVSAFAVVVAAVAFDRWGWRVTAPTVLLLGDGSYALYLSHPYITQPAQKLAGHANLGIAASALAVAITLLGACMAAVCLHRWVELPLTQRARRLLLR